MLNVCRLHAFVVLIAVCGGGVASAQATAPALNPAVAPVDWRVSTRCGVNSLYVMLRMLNRPVTYEQLLKDTAVGEQGSSVAELARLASLHGVHLTPAHATISSTSRWPVPAIVHLQRQANVMGHYVLYLGSNGDEHRLLDCTSGETKAVLGGEFNSNWSGYVLLRGEAIVQRMSPWISRGWLMIGAIVFFGFGVRRWYRQRRAAPGPNESMTGLRSRPGSLGVAVCSSLILAMVAGILLSELRADITPLSGDEAQRVFGGQSSWSAYAPRGLEVRANDRSNLGTNVY
jgi:hypothetical protein